MTILLNHLFPSNSVNHSKLYEANDIGSVYEIKKFTAVITGRSGDKMSHKGDVQYPFKSDV